MIRQGKLCRHCSDKSCKDLGTEQEPIEIECPSCNGLGQDCEQCDDGHFKVIGCPNAYCSKLSHFVELSELFDNGCPPVAGGSLDQTVWFLEASRRLKNEEANIKVESYNA